MSEPAIEFVAVSKRFRQASVHRGLKERLVGLAQRPGRREPSATEDHYTLALRGLDLRVMPGEAVAVVGRNGSGKSTCLALAAQVLKPTSGQVTVRGRVHPLLALGAGVHPDLTGRENVQLNGVLLGMTRREVRQRFAAIHDFSELGHFIDQPVRHYSSGMLARLAFAVATHLDPQVLIIDEILAVGDAAFQIKCQQRIEEFRGRGVTMLYVSHDVHSVMQLCDHAVYLDHGQVMARGDTFAVCRHYYADQGLTLLPPPGSAPAPGSALAPSNTANPAAEER